MKRYYEMTTKNERKIESQYGTVAVRRNDAGEIDEIVASGEGRTVLHLERMDDKVVWIGVDVPGLDTIHIDLCHDDPGDRINIQAEQR